MEEEQGLRILQVVQGFPPEFIGGTEFYCRALARALQERGHRCFVLAGSNQQAREPALVTTDEEGICVTRYVSPLPLEWRERQIDPYNPEAEQVIRRHLQLVRPAVVHVHHWLRLTSNIVSLAAELSIPAVVTLHDLWMSCPRIHRQHREGYFCVQPSSPQLCLTCVPRVPWQEDKEVFAALGLRERRIATELEQARCLILPSTSHKEFLLRLLPLSPERIRVIPHGSIVSLSRARKDSVPLFPHRPLRLAYWGYLDHHKGPHLILEALRLLPDPREVEVHFMGMAPDERYESRLRELSADLAVTFWGAYQPHDLLRLDADTAVFPSLAAESYSFTLDEAFQLALPVIVSDRGALAERVGKAGMVFPAGDPAALAERITAILREPERLTEMRRHIPPSPSFTEHAEAIVQIYREVMVERPEATFPDRTCLEEMAYFQNCVEARDRTVYLFTLAVEEREKKLREKEREQAEEIACIREELQKELREKEREQAEEIACMREELQKKLREKEREQAEEIACMREELEAWAEWAEKIRHSTGWKLLERFYTLRERWLAPPGTWRGRVYDAVKRRFTQWLAGEVFLLRAKDLTRFLWAGRKAIGSVAGVLATTFLSLSVLPLAVVGVVMSLYDFWTRRASAGSQTAAADLSGEKAGQLHALSAVIPSWNGKELLAVTLPTVVRAVLREDMPDNEIIVVDNGSSDGTGEFLRTFFPQVRILMLTTNQGFASACNLGVQESHNDIVLLLNNDMAVHPDFLDPLLEVFAAEPQAFAVSCQIRFWETGRRQEETGKTHIAFRWGLCEPFHHNTYADDTIYPILYPGGGSSAFRRKKFLDLGGFDKKTFSPFYGEDTDLGYRAWKRGWPSFFQPRSIVYHRHRSTTRRLYSEKVLDSLLWKNMVLFTWKNITSPSLFLRHLLFLPFLPYRLYRRVGMWATIRVWPPLFVGLPRALAARYRESPTWVLTDEEILRCSRYCYYYNEVFRHRPQYRPGERLRVLWVTPYSPLPAVHGGAVRMFNLLKHLQEHCDIALVSYGDTDAEFAPGNLAALQDHCSKVALIRRDGRPAVSPLTPHVAYGFSSPEMEGALEDVLERWDPHLIQFDYTQMAHFQPLSCRRPSLLVEHDISFVTVGRKWKSTPGVGKKALLWVDWMKTLRYELTHGRQMDRVITMSDHDREVLRPFLNPEKITVVPNGVDCHHHAYREEGREEDTLLFVGFFRHTPNVEAALFFHQAIWPLIRRERPGTRLYLVGAYPPREIMALARDPQVVVTGEVTDVYEYYSRCTGFVAPITRGSGTRVKILEAMASGCPVVSTTIGVEGLGVHSGQEVLLADTPEKMAQEVLRLLHDGELRRRLTRQARQFVEKNYAWEAIAAKLLHVYRQEVERKIAAAETL